jgi:hypothetical protein
MRKFFSKSGIFRGTLEKRAFNNFVQIVFETLYEDSPKLKSENLLSQKIYF